MGAKAITAALLAALPSVAAGQVEEAVARRSYETARIAGAPPVVDGALDESIWESVEWSGGFVQREPADGIATASLFVASAPGDNAKCEAVQVGGRRAACVS